MRKIAVIYHGGCPDGFGAAYAAWKKFGSKADYFGVKHSDAPLALKGKEIYFLDIIYREDELRKLEYVNTRVTAIDHHISQKELVESTENYSYALNHSGATLAWQYFHPSKTTPLLLRYIEDNDIWKLALPKTLEVDAWLATQPMDFKKWDVLAKNLEKANFRKKVFAEGSILLAQAKIMAAKIIKDNAVKVELDGHKVYAVNSPTLINEIGQALYEKHPPFAIIWNQTGDWIKISMRGTGKVDLAKLALKFGGGGHKSAAGFSVPTKQGLPFKYHV